MDKRAVEQGGIHFFELAALSVEVNTNRRNVSLKLKDFVIPPDDVPEEARRAVKHWSQWIDYWAVDWDNQGDLPQRMADLPDAQGQVARAGDHAQLSGSRRIRDRREGYRHPR